MCPSLWLLLWGRRRNTLTHNRDFSPVQANQCYTPPVSQGWLLLKQQPGQKQSLETEWRQSGHHPPTDSPILDVVAPRCLCAAPTFLFYFIASDTRCGIKNADFLQDVFKLSDQKEVCRHAHSASSNSSLYAPAV